MVWHVFANTEMASPDDICEPGEEPIVENQGEVLVGGRSIMILVGKKPVQKKSKKVKK
jgi:glycogen operon protein